MLGKVWYQRTYVLIALGLLWISQIIWCDTRCSVHTSPQAGERVDAAMWLDPAGQVWLAGLAGRRSRLH